MASSSSSSSFPVQYFSLKKCLLFLVVVCVYASLFACREVEALLERRDSLGGRKALLVLDDEFEEIQPKKKKSTVAKETEGTQLKKKVVSTGELDEKKPMKKNSVVDEEAEQLPRKKKSFVDEMEEKPKKKKTSAEKSEDLKFEKKKTTTEELVEQKPKKKQANSDELEVELPRKKKSTILEEDEDKVPKKKKAKISEEEGRVPKKKKTTLEEEDELPKKKKGNIVAEEDSTQKKKKTSTEEDVDDVPKKKKKAPIEDVEEQPKKKKKAPIEEVEEQAKKKKGSTEEVEEQGKKKKITTGGTAQTKFIKPIKDNKNQTKFIKFPSAASKTNPKSLNSTSNPSKSSLSLSKKSAELPKTQSKTTQEKKSTNVNQLPKSKSKPQSLHSDDDEDLITEFRDLPSKFQSDIKRFSTTSKVYLSNANREISQSFRPLIGSKYASIIASVSPYIFLLVPLIILPLIYGRIRNFFLPLQTILIFAQIYLSIYFSILCLSYLVTGMEPLKVYYATSKASYVYTQVLQTLAYVLFLLVQVMYLVVVFATKERGTGSRLVSLAQMFVGLAIGIHYYVSVAHRAVLREPPRTNWKVHAIYAACFTGVCLLARAERRKKAYLQEGGEEGKQN